MRFRFSPVKRERMIFMGTLLPEEKKVRDLIEDVDDYEEQCADMPDDGGTGNIVKNEAGL